MSNLNDLTALCLPTGSRLAADETQSRLSLRLEGQPMLTLRLIRDPELLENPEFVTQALLAFLVECNPA